MVICSVRFENEVLTLTIILDLAPMYMMSGEITLTARFALSLDNLQTMRRWLISCMKRGTKAAVVLGWQQTAKDYYGTCAVTLTAKFNVS